MSILSVFSNSAAIAVTTDNVALIEGGGVITASSILQILLSLMLVIFLIIVASWLYKKYGNITSPLNDKFKVVSGLSLGPKEKIVLIQVGDEQILVGISPGMIRNIHTLNKCLEINEGVNIASPRISFIERFNSELLKYKKP